MIRIIGGADHSSRNKSDRKNRGADHSSRSKCDRGHRGADHSSRSQRDGKHRGADHSSRCESDEHTVSSRGADHSSGNRRATRDVHSSKYKAAKRSSTKNDGKGADQSRRSRRKNHSSRDTSESRTSDTSTSLSDTDRRSRKRRSGYTPEEHTKRIKLDHRRARSPAASLPKRARDGTSDSSGTSESDSSDEDEQLNQFDPSLEHEDRDEYRVDVAPRIQKYLNRHFRKGLTKEERTAMLKKHPKANVKAAQPPKLDQFVSEFAGKKLDKARDAQLARVQGSVLYVSNPLTNLWADLIDKGLTQNPEGVVSVAVVMETIQRSLVLLGNANNLISETRREVALEAIHPSLKKYGKGDFSQAEDNLFGEAFKETLVKKVEADSVLAKAVNIVNRSSKGRDGHFHKSQTRFTKKNRFFGSRTSGYGAASGRTYNPYSSRGYQGRGKQTPGRPFVRKSGVFSRLGPQNQSTSQHRSV